MVKRLRDDIGGVVEAIGPNEHPRREEPRGRGVERAQEHTARERAMRKRDCLLCRICHRGRRSQSGQFRDVATLECPELPAGFDGVWVGSRIQHVLDFEPQTQLGLDAPAVRELLSQQADRLAGTACVKQHAREL